MGIPGVATKPTRMQRIRVPICPQDVITYEKEIQNIPIHAQTETENKEST